MLPMTPVFDLLPVKHRDARRWINRLRMLAAVALDAGRAAEAEALDRITYEIEDYFPEMSDE